jgi:hypothetical protein
MDRPYIVSGDIFLLLEQWTNQNGFGLPQKEFFSRLRQQFSVQMHRMFGRFELVSEEEICDGLGQLVAESGLPAVSLDPVYNQTEVTLEVARLVDQTGEDRGIGRRAGMPPLYQQIRRLGRSGRREVVIVDDVIFTGRQAS